ncbi:unnamed protein product [Nezara viridula]|uniref:Uncharacterized protein n=1 Tax=Nezara viridula TaxID=85310 RepID=A0A9P0H407_NEZVI|nr:unnamed protein product [Nezara viridula]
MFSDRKSTAVSQSWFLKYSNHIMMLTTSSQRVTTSAASQENIRWDASLISLSPPNVRSRLHGYVCQGRVSGFRRCRLVYRIPRAWQRLSRYYKLTDNNGVISFVQRFID